MVTVLAICLEIGSDWNERIQSMGDYPHTAIPTNIVPGIFTQAAADNADFNSDNLNGKDAVHIKSLVLYQGQTATIEPGNFLPNIPTRKKGQKRCSIDFRGGQKASQLQNKPRLRAEAIFHSNRLLKLQERPNKMWLRTGLGYYHSLAGQTYVWHGCKSNLAGPQIYLQPAKIKTQHFGVWLKFLVCNGKYYI